MKKKELKQQIDELTAIVEDMRNELDTVKKTTEALAYKSLNEDFDKAKLSGLKELKSNNLQSGNDKDVVSEEELQDLTIEDCVGDIINMEVFKGNIIIKMIFDDVLMNDVLMNRQQAEQIRDYINKYLDSTKVIKRS